MSNNKKVALKGNSSGLYFVEGLGFVAEEIKNATQLAIEAVDNVQKAIALAGGEQSQAVEVPNLSFAVSFIRQKDLDGEGGVNPHRLNPSARRFGSREEALHHGARFTVLEDHLGFYVTPSTDPVNSHVNQATGKTNPVIGRGRTDR